MIPVLKTEKGFEALDGSPTLTSLDGETRAPLAVILHPSWTDEERAKFGVFMVEPMAIPEGKQAISIPRYEEDADGKVIQVVDLADIVIEEPKPTALDLLRQDLEALAQRVTTLEAGRASAGSRT